MYWNPYYIEYSSDGHTPVVTASLIQMSLHIANDTKPTCVHMYKQPSLITYVYVRHTNPFVNSGILYNDISDHLRRLRLIGKRKPSIKSSEPLICKHRPISDMSMCPITYVLHEFDWTYLHKLDIYHGLTECIRQLNNVIYYFT